MSAAQGRVYFYPHAYLRDRQLDVVRRWPRERVANPELAEGRRGGQVSRAAALSGRIAPSWRSRLPLPNVKRRPAGAPADAAVYVWGAVVASGPFIVDLDNPYALTGYNIPAMRLWAAPLGWALGRPRCLEIRCLSRACREGVARLFGGSAAAKARVVYPSMSPAVPAPPPHDGPPRFLFVGSQFEIKGGAALLRVFPRVRAALPGATLDLISHLPDDRAALAAQPGVSVRPATLGRAEVWRDHMARADVLVHPTYVESFGMAVLEAMAHGAAVVATDVYALGEMVDDANGALLAPPVSIWRGVEPAPLYLRLAEAPRLVRALDTTAFEARLADAMIALARDPARLQAARAASLARVRERFA